MLAALLPENAIVADESITNGRNLGPYMTKAAPHDWLNICGGSIGWAMPIATGAAVAAPDRKVIALEGDGSGMYTLQALWTMARENLDVTVIILANRSYQILKGELKAMGAGTPGKRATDMLNLDRPALDWVALARGHGVEGVRTDTLEGFAREFERANARRGPLLIELVIHVNRGADPPRQDLAEHVLVRNPRRRGDAFRRSQLVHEGGTFLAFDQCGSKDAM